MISNTRQRIKMLMLAARQRRFDKRTLKDFHKILNAWQKAGDKRIRAAHGRWLLDDSLPEAIIWMPHAGAHLEALVYEMADLEASRLEIIEVSRRLQEFFRTELLPLLKEQTIRYAAAAAAWEQQKTP